MKRILVTGGAGFLGSHLCEKLLQAGHEVLSVNNYFTGRKSNITHLLNNPYFEAIRHDITFPLDKEKLDWQPEVTLKEVLKMTIVYFDSLLSHKEPVSISANTEKMP